MKTKWSDRAVLSQSWKAFLLLLTISSVPTYVFSNDRLPTNQQDIDKLALATIGAIESIYFADRESERFDLLRELLSPNTDVTLALAKMLNAEADPDPKAAKWIIRILRATERRHPGSIRGNSEVISQLRKFRAEESLRTRSNAHIRANQLILEVSDLDQSDYDFIKNYAQMNTGNLPSRNLSESEHIFFKLRTFAEGRGLDFGNFFANTEPKNCMTVSFKIISKPSMSIDSLLRILSLCGGRRSSDELMKVSTVRKALNRAIAYSQENPAAKAKLEQLLREQDSPLEARIQRIMSFLEEQGKGELERARIMREIRLNWEGRDFSLYHYLAARFGVPVDKVFEWTQTIPYEEGLSGHESVFKHLPEFASSNGIEASKANEIITSAREQFLRSQILDSDILANETGASNKTIRTVLDGNPEIEVDPKLWQQVIRGEEFPIEREATRLASIQTLPTAQSPGRENAGCFTGFDGIDTRNVLPFRRPTD